MLSDFYAICHIYLRDMGYLSTYLKRNWILGPYPQHVKRMQIILWYLKIKCMQMPMP